MINLNELQTAIGYQYSDTHYVVRALTHASANNDPDAKDYERLEFLGDRVVNLIVADLLFKHYPMEQEGALAKRHTALVRTETLSELALDLGLDNFVILSDAQRRAGGAQNANILADITEAITATIYLDGGYDAAKLFFEQALGNRLHQMKEPPRDPKTALQEWSQANNLGLPIYELIDQSGPDHEPQFTIQVTIEGHTPHTATSHSKKQAQKMAAQSFLDSVHSS